MHQYLQGIHAVKHYITIAFNEIDIRIYLPEKVNITFKGRYILMSTEIEVQFTVLLNGVTIVNELDCN